MNSTAGTAMAAAKNGDGPVAAFTRFVVFGGGTGLAASGVLLLLSRHMSLALANAIVSVVSTVVANELHSRLTFRSGERGWRMHAKSSGTVVVGYIFTTAAMMSLHALVAAPSVITEQAVYLSASALAGIGRFAVLRVYVFAKRAKAPNARPAGKPAVAPALDRAAVAVAA
ncbi:GtrA family protein [Yinghuangia sp. ASG 101]|uniref:GtrA family protein n=1 Tax=Yinghuangia sp. ASG 101 TaxID=2896848 RepID=UPI001E438517|nr:GtrA family protein [Yinghuangia sp. ASG 101]UGQ10672.1 GtrA family protein [Yinghuangia sp. ASG 101]